MHGSVLHSFPAAHALLQVGGKATDAIVGSIGGDDLDFELEIMAQDLLEIEGDPRLLLFG